MYNWARSTKLGNTDQIVKIHSLDELSSLLSSLAPYQKVKVLGSGMSFPSIGSVDDRPARYRDILLDISALSGLVELSEDSATFWAGSTLEFVTDTLLSHGKQIICCPGVLLTQTLAGALATGTHGQGFANGGIYDAALTIQVALPGGKISTFNHSLDPLNPFHAFKLHLGALGILTQVTLKIEPMKIYRQVRQVVDFPRLTAHFTEWNETASHCKAWWFPETDHVQLWRTFEAKPEDIEAFHQNSGKMLEVESKADESYDLKEFTSSLNSLVVKMENDTKESTSSQLTHAGPVVPGGRFETVLRFQHQTDRVGNMYQLWCKGIPAPQVNCEIAVPVDRLNDALAALRQYCIENGTMHYPFILRATGPSQAWLSPSHGQKMVYIGFLVYLSETTYTGNVERLQVLRDVESKLVQFSAIPHYGKFFTLSNYNFPALLPRFNDFQALRQKLDPQGHFVNKYIRDLLQVPIEDQVIESRL